MNQTNIQDGDAYTVVVFRGSTAKPIRFSFSKKLLRRLLVCVGLVVLADLLVVSHYAIRTGEVWELAAFRTEAMSAREQTAAFSTAIDDLKKRLGAMNEVNQRLRVMLGIEVPKTGDMANGRGGEEVPISEEGGSIPGRTELDVSSGISKQTSEGNQEHSSAVGLEPSRDALQAITSVKEGLEWLSKQATVQERILDELSQAAEQRSSRWASTPSIWPVKGWVTSGFGPRISPFTEKPAWHDGLDIGAAPNTPVRAPAQGRITSVGYDPKLGNMVRVDHGFGVETLYGHLAKALVKEGQRVERGDVIALVGSSGLSTGPHLHYMVKLNGQALDPTKYILE
ncbi:MAG: M23 family metallopeptidase [Nitrospira sp.]|nr:M23 family metallopeptidase [Nitrospira sp.]MDH4250590.1 M23 family metallopeptidase [Nitrospira sp.]MDH4343101.1 M23 family metallopeptidase [Nitrospira sp.]MDH5336463.1 M23 family metallopeptidase [Nitrospira sp.]